MSMVGIAVTAQLVVAQLSAGQTVCWMAPLPKESPRTSVEARVLKVARLPSGEEGVWLEAEKFPGSQFHVAAADLRPCTADRVAVSPLTPVASPGQAIAKSSD